MLPQEAWDIFIQEHAKILATYDLAYALTLSNSVPKQYGGVSSQTCRADATLVESTDTLKVVDASNTSSDDEETV